MDKKEEKIIKDSIKEFLKNLEIEGEFELLFQEESVEVVLETKDSGIVIGRHGDVLESIQTILGLIVSKKLGRFIRVSVEIGDYKKNRMEYLESLAEQTKQKVLAEDREISLSSLKPWERRIVHMYLKDDQEVTSESVGEGKERTLVVKRR